MTATDMENTHVQPIPRTSHQPEDDGRCLIDFLIRRTTEYPGKIAFCNVDIDLNESPMTYSQYTYPQRLDRKFDF